MRFPFCENMVYLPHSAQKATMFSENIADSWDCGLAEGRASIPLSPG